MLSCPIPGPARDARFRLERRLSSSFLQGTRPRFASGTLMSLRTIPPFLAGGLCGCGRVFRTCASDNRAETLSASLLERAGAHLPALLQGNPPSRVLRFSLLRCGEHPRGYPDVASGGYSYPAPARFGTSRGGAVSSVVTSGCPKRSEGGCPCRNEDERRPSSNATYHNEKCSFHIFKI